MTSNRCARSATSHGTTIPSTYPMSATTSTGQGEVERKTTGVVGEGKERHGKRQDWVGGEGAEGPNHTR